MVMKKKNPLLDELNEQAPYLGSLKEKSSGGMKVPADYFAGLETEVFRQLEAIGAQRQPAPGPGRPSLWQLLQSLWQPRVALAFAGVLTLAVSAWWYFSPVEPAAPVAAAAITADDAEAYLMDNLMELEPEQIVEVLPSDGLPSIIINPEPKSNGQQGAQDIELRQEDLDNLLRDMTDEELRDLLL